MRACRTTLIRCPRRRCHRSTPRCVDRRCLREIASIPNRPPSPTTTWYVRRRSHDLCSNLSLTISLSMSSMHSVPRNVRVRRTRHVAVREADRCHLHDGKTSRRVSRLEESDCVLNAAQGTSADCSISPQVGCAGNMLGSLSRW